MRVFSLLVLILLDNGENEVRLPAEEEEDRDEDGEGGGAQVLVQLPSDHLVCLPVRVPTQGIGIQMVSILVRIFWIAQK